MLHKYILKKQFESAAVCGGFKNGHKNPAFSKYSEGNHFFPPYYLGVGTDKGNWKRICINSSNISATTICKMMRAHTRRNCLVPLMLRKARL